MENMSILFWNEVALEANKLDFTLPPPQEEAGPTLSSRALAIVHIAMYDGFFGNTGRKPTYTGVRSNSGGLPDAAIAGAAHAALSYLYPRQRDRFDAKLAECGVNQSDPGFEFGIEAADAILRLRGVDPDAHSFYRETTKSGHHRRDPLNQDQGYHGAAYGWAPRFAVTSDHALCKPPECDSSAYIDAHKQVFELGGAADLGTNRKDVETAVGVYWAYDGVSGLGTPPRLYNLIAKHVLLKKVPTFTREALSEAELVEVLTLMNVAMGDAGILAWREKYKWDVWRPVIGIRYGNSASATHMNWRPLGAPRTNTKNPRTGLPDTPFTPSFPAYPSGHATFGAASFQMLRLFLKDRFPNTFKFGDRKPDEIAFDFQSEELNGVSFSDPIEGISDPKTGVRYARPVPYPSLWQAIRDNGRSRVFLGLHWVFDAYDQTEEDTYPKDGKNIGGVPLGLNIAEDIFGSFKDAGRELRPPSQQRGGDSNYYVVARATKP